MEIDITKIINDMPDAYGSRLTHGQDAGTITWNNALNYAKELYLLTTDQVLAVKKHIKEFGAWSESEINSWNHTELEALFVQLVLAEYSESGIEEGRIFEADNKYYYTCD